MDPDWQTPTFESSAGTMGATNMKPSIEAARAEGARSPRGAILDRAGVDLIKKIADRAPQAVINIEDVSAYTRATKCFVGRDVGDCIQGFGVITPPFDLMWLETPFHVLELGTKVPGGYLVEHDRDNRLFKMMLFYGPSYAALLPHIVHFGYDETGRFNGDIRVSDHPSIMSFEQQEARASADLGEVTADHIYAISAMLDALFALGLMNCKNVRREPEPDTTPLKVRNKRERRGWHHYQYERLIIPGITGARAAEVKADEAGVALHMVRGHFKHYTPDAPLLGKLTGTYWWHPHVRGSIEHGLVEKTYRPRPGTAT